MLDIESAISIINFLCPNELVCQIHSKYGFDRADTLRWIFNRGVTLEEPLKIFVDEEEKKIPDVILYIGHHIRYLLI